MHCLLDTDICIYIIKKKPQGVLKKLAEHAVSDIGISSITVAELLYGVEKSAMPDKNRDALDEFLAPFEIMPFDDRAAEVYGRIRAVLERKGTPIGSMDMLIAAHALSLGVMLVTNNAKEFKRVPHLQVANWV
ncbi:MAG: type II toxin-antitoxin system VapC family toxin [Deltaproteobacteria bacterium]|nr:type II toxin-antitoxin system VapC family toxin [Deltaproteobacteria bacterium]